MKKREFRQILNLRSSVNRRDAAGQIFVFDFFEPDLAHHFGEFFLVGETRNRIGQILIRAARTADRAADSRKNVREIKLKRLTKAGNDRRGKF